MIDLQTHTTASDGTCTPTELLRLAREAGLSAVGITDHDTVAGLPEATAAAAEEGVELVPGIEISVDYPNGEFHLLGYFVDYTSPDFTSRLQHLQDNRVNRNVVMVRRMREHGYEISWQDVVAESGGGQVGRPHMAAALVRKGYASSVRDAFDRLVGDGRPLHVPKVRLTAGEAIRMVRNAGGVAVLAHPKLLGRRTEEALLKELSGLKEQGLDGLECYYSGHSEAETRRFLRLASRLELLVTAGSDFHGGSKPAVGLGRIYRDQPGDPRLLEALRAAADHR